MVSLEHPEASGADDEQDDPPSETGSERKRFDGDREPSADFDLFAGIDIGRIIPSINIARHVPKIDFAGSIPKLDTAMFETLSKIDFGRKPIIDAAILKSLSNLFDAKSLLPLGVFAAFAAYKFPELQEHPDAIREIEDLTVVSSRDLVHRDHEHGSDLDEVLAGETATNKGVAGLDATAFFLESQKQTAIGLRTVELLAQTVNLLAKSEAEEATARTHAAESKAVAAKVRKMNRILKGLFSLAMIVIAALTLLVSL